MKLELRNKAKKRRQAHVDDIGDAGVRGAGEAACQHLFKLALLDQPTTISAYWPLPGEFDSRPLMAALHAAGHQIVLPVVVGRAKPLIFRCWQPGLNMSADRFDVLVPPDDSPVLRPSVLLVPLLAFDARGYRLGYGGGFYDRTLAALSARGDITAIGLAFAMQEVDKVPIDAYDQALHWLVSDHAARKFQREAAS